MQSRRQETCRQVHQTSNDAHTLTGSAHTLNRGARTAAYADLESRTSTQRYGLQLNVNLLGLFPKTRHGRWSLELSPHAAAVGTKSTIRTVGGTDVLRGGARWHFGAGGNVQAAYRITQCVSVGVYSGLTYLTGDPMDGMPEYRHKSNFIWESGIRLGWNFGTKRAGGGR